MPFLRTERIQFRPWSPDDLPLALELWGDPKVTAMIDARGQLSEEQVRERLTREIATMDAHGVQYWPMFLLADGEFVGCCGLRPYKLEEGIYELGVHLRSQYWGRGYAMEACRAVVEYAFQELGAAGLFAGHNPNNERSRRLLEKLGFRYTHDELYPATGLRHPSYVLRAGTSPALTI